MTYKQRILFEIERKYEEWKLGNSVEAKYRCEAYKELIELIKPIQKEPVSEFPDTEPMIELHRQKLISQVNGMKDSPFVNMCLDSYKQGISEILDTLNLSNVEKTVKDWKEEPVSEELEDTTQTITYKGEVYIRCYKDKLDAFACKYPMSVPKTSKKYAKYSDVDLTIAIKAGAKWQEEQLKNSAIDATIGYFNHTGLSIDAKLPKDLKEGSKCKLIIIKDK